MSAAEAPTPGEPLRALAWSAPPADVKNMAGMIWVNLEDGTADPVKAAEESKKKPAGMAAVFMVHGAAGLIGDPGDRCVTADGKPTAFPGPWLDHGIAAEKARTEQFFRAYQAAGGRLDLLTMDFEGGFSVAQMGTRLADYLHAIQNDPRAPALKQEFGLTDADFDDTIQWFTHSANYRLGDDLGAVLQKYTPPYLIWNAAMEKIVCRALNQSVFQPVLALYPHARASNYGSYVLSKKDVCPDANGNLQFQSGYCGTAGSAPFFGEIGELALHPMVSGHLYGRTPFGTLRWHVNTIRAIRRSGDVPFQAWISNKSYAGSLFRDNGYYQELIDHLALSGVRDFFYWNPDRGQPGQDPASLRTDDQDRLLDQCLETLNQKLGAVSRKCITLESAAWDSPILATGMQLGTEKVLWRISVPPGVKQVKVVPGGELLDLKGGTGAWYESKPGVKVSFEDVPSVMVPVEHPYLLKVGDVTRTYYLHIPPGDNGKQSVPLVILLHGRGGTAIGAYDYTRMGEKSDQEGFLLAYPEALGEVSEWKVGFNSGMKDPSDVNFLSALIDHLIKTRHVDPDRVFIAGHSSGAMMAYRFASEHSEQVAAIGVVAGTIGARDPQGKLTMIRPPARPVSVIAFHGTKDPIMPYSPADTWVFDNNFLSAKESAAYWAKQDGCSPISRIEVIGDGTVIKDDYTGGKEGTEVVLYSITGGDHWWPGDKDAAPFIPPADEAASATDLIWDFFARHGRHDSHP